MASPEDNPAPFSLLSVSGNALVFESTSKARDGSRPLAEQAVWFFEFIQTTRLGVQTEELENLLALDGYDAVWAPTPLGNAELSIINLRCFMGTPEAEDWAQDEAKIGSIEAWADAVGEALAAKAVRKGIAETGSRWAVRVEVLAPRRSEINEWIRSFAAEECARIEADSLTAVTRGASRPNGGAKSETTTAGVGVDGSASLSRAKPRAL